MSKATAVDTNILVYLHDMANHPKRSVAANVLFQRPKISAQVISEHLNATRKLLSLLEEGLLSRTAQVLGRCEIINTRFSTLTLAAELVKKYRLQLFDAVIAAACLDGNCDILIPKTRNTVWQWKVN